MTEMHNNLKSIENERKEIEAAIADLKTKIPSFAERAAPLEVERKKVQAEFAELNKSSSEIKTLAEGIIHTLRENKQIRSILEKRIGTERELLEEAMSERDKVHAQLEELREKASTFCEEVKVTSSVRRIQADIETCENRVAEEQKGKKTLEEITAEFRSGKRTYRSTVQKISLCRTLSQKLSRNLDQRMAKWDSFRKSIARRTTVFFNSYLTQKNYAGEIRFDHKKKELNIKVQLDATRNDTSRTTNNTLSLSGGERSFATVALLLSLWEAMETPFRAMDEFDVFMDAVNRKISLKLLINAARSQGSRQFIFITPHEISSIGNAADVRVHRMRPPERNQASLPFT
eukprot:TRINITY_DN1568_c0_g6_i1.p1 TRINITY_DN1568_c0_g6~~TRINITY_DN1568_c0_g6_i1.p1  ORF type:complete len:357 (-),score=78.01 TRINITY_DN1568_c0_g6_i1:511-1548(-)